MTYTIIGYTNSPVSHKNDKTGEWTTTQEIHLITTTPINPHEGYGVQPKKFWIETNNFSLIYKGKKTPEEMLGKECYITVDGIYNHIGSLAFVDEM